MKKLILTFGLLFLTCGSALALSMPRWGMTSVDVYIPQNEMSSSVQRAFNTWAAASGNKLRFRFNSTRFASNNAPIRVEFLAQKAPYYLSRASRSETTGYFTNMDSGFINRASITFYTTTREDKPATADEIYRNALLEVGYILGLDKYFGDCQTNKSVMCVNGTSTTLSDEDRQLIQEKYTRTSKDIENAKSKNK